MSFIAPDDLPFTFLNLFDAIPSYAVPDNKPRFFTWAKEFFPRDLEVINKLRKIVCIGGSCTCFDST